MNISHATNHATIFQPVVRYGAMISCAASLSPACMKGLCWSRVQKWAHLEIIVDLNFVLEHIVSCDRAPFDLSWRDAHDLSCRFGLHAVQCHSNRLDV